MTALGRLVDARRLSQTATENVSHQKQAAAYAGRELRDADEANLLDDEDMQVFGLSPMTDPLDLVCCNACKKPIKASQYAVHAELCKSFSYKVGINLELDDPAVTKKPPRKERKKSQTTQTKSLEDLTKCPAKPLKRTAADNPPNLGTKNLCETAAKILPYVPAPLATKTYYFQRNHHLRNAISIMFFREPDKS